MRSLLLLFAVFIVAMPSCLCNGTVTSIWKQLNLFPVCFEGKGNKPGEVRNYGEGKLIGALKLVYRSGSIRCAIQEAYTSRWGCYHNKFTGKYPLNVIITDKSYKKVFPLDQYITKGSLKHGLWYYLPFVDALHSDELVFSNYMNSFYLPKHGTLSVWYGEDLKDWHEKDNIGKVCVDVYVHALL